MHCHKLSCAIETIDISTCFAVIVPNVWKVSKTTARPGKKRSMIWLQRCQNTENNCALRLQRMSNTLPQNPIEYRRFSQPPSRQSRGCLGQNGSSARSKPVISLPVSYCYYSEWSVIATSHWANRENTMMWLQYCPKHKRCCTIRRPIAFMILLVLKKKAARLKTKPQHRLNSQRWIYPSQPPHCFCEIRGGE